MAVEILENPYGIPGSLDYPQSPARLDIPLWSENYIWQGSDPDTGIFFYHLIGRMPGHPDHWRAVFQCTLPDGDILSWKTYGRDTSVAGPVAGAFRATCIEPLRRWRIQYDGVAPRRTRADNRTRLLPGDAQPQPVEFDVMWDGTTPMWNLGSEANRHMDTQPVWNLHLEQAGVVRGHVRYEGELISFEGVGYRDHSVGQRDLSTGLHHTWLHASFPKSRRHLGLLTLTFRHTDYVALSGYSVTAGKLHESTVAEYPVWPAGEALYEPGGFTVIMETDAGLTTVEAQLLDPSFYFTVAAPSEIHLGYQSDPEPGRGEVWACREVMCRCTLDGEVGYGFLEISRRHESERNGDNDE